MNYLLDTCVISELITRKPSTLVMDWVDGIEQERLYLSVITIGEIQRGIAKLVQSRRKEMLEKWLQEELLLRFQGQTLSITVDTMMNWGRLTAQGRTLPAMDALLAAQVIQHNLCLVTRNVKDFAGLELKIINPWLPA